MATELSRKKVIILDTDHTHNFLISMVFNRLGETIDPIILRDSADLQNIPGSSDPCIFFVNPDICQIENSDFLNIKTFMDRRNTIGILHYLTMEPVFKEVWERMGFDYIVPKPFTKATGVKVLEAYKNSPVSA